MRINTSFCSDSHHSTRIKLQYKNSWNFVKIKLCYEKKRKVRIFTGKVL